MRRQHHVGHAKRCAQAFRERVRVNHAFGRIDALQRGDGSSCQAKLAVVVVLDDIAVRRFGRPAQQLVAAAHAGHDAGGELVRRRDVQRVDARRAHRGHGNARRVKRKVGEFDVVALVDLREAWVARVFDADTAVSTDKLDEQVVQRLRARAHHDVFRRGGKPARLPQVVRNLFAQLDAAERVGLADERCRGLLGQRVAQRFRPRGKREQLAGHGAARQIEAVFVGLARVARDARAALCDVSRCGGPALADFRREISASGARLHVPFRDELPIGAFHGHYADAQVVGQFAFRRQFLAGRYRSAFDVGAYAFIQVCVQGLFAAVVYVVRQHIGSNWS